MAKKGQVTILLVFVVIILAVVGYFAVNWMSSQQAITDDLTEDGIGGTGVGEASKISIDAYDREPDPDDRFAGTYYCWDNLAPGTLLANAGTLSATASTSLASGINVGDDISCITFNTSYYGVTSTIKIDAEAETLELSSHRAPETYWVKVYDDGSSLTAGNIGTGQGAIFFNLTLSASETDALDSIRLDLNESDRAYNVKGICFNLVESSNINNIIVGDMTRGTAPSRLTRTSMCEYYYEITDAEMIHEFDEFVTGAVQIEATATNPAETINFTFIDEGHFVSSAVDTNNQILTGIEDDAPTSTDVGTADAWYSIVIL
jgi:hypothetical protein